MLFALSVLVNWAWFFTILFPFLFILQVGLQLQNEGIEGIPSSLDACGFLFGTVLWFGFLGRFFDMCYLTLTRYESFFNLFRKHLIWWILLVAAVIPGMYYFTVMVLGE